MIAKEIFFFRFDARVACLVLRGLGAGKTGQWQGSNVALFALPRSAKCSRVMSVDSWRLV